MRPASPNKSSPIFAHGEAPTIPRAITQYHATNPAK